MLLLQGRYEEAQQMYAAAKAASRDDVPAVIARIEGKLGELAFKRGDPKTASQSIARGMRLLGKRVPGNPLSSSVFLAREFLVQILHTFLPKLLVGRRRLDESEQESAAVKLYSRLAYAY